MGKCFLLKIDFSQCLDSNMTVHIIDNTDVDLPHLLNSSKHEFGRDKVYARANLLHLPKFDFIANDLGIFVIGPNFIKISGLSNCDDYDLVPLVLLDDTYSGKFFEKNGELNNEIKKMEGYYTLNFNKQRDYCDKEKSAFRKIRSQPDSIGLLKQVVLKHQKDNNWPMIFKIKESMSMLFVSESLKMLLEKSSIKGCLFEEVEVSENVIA